MIASEISHNNNIFSQNSSTITEFLEQKEVLVLLHTQIVKILSFCICFYYQSSSNCRKVMAKIRDNLKRLLIQVSNKLCCPNCYQELKTAGEILYISREHILKRIILECQSYLYVFRDWPNSINRKGINKLDQLWAKCIIIRRLYYEK